MITEMPVTLTGNSGKTSAGSMRRETWDRRERMHRALRFMLYTWLAGAFCIILPVIHFVLVPALLIAGPIGAWVIYGQESVIQGGKGSCPECGNAFDLSRAWDQWPISDLCPHCQQRLRVEPA